MDNVVRELFEEMEEGKGSDENLLTEVGKLGKEKKVDATLIGTISSYKEDVEDRYDGFVIAVVKWVRG